MNSEMFDNTSLVDTETRIRLDSSFTTSQQNPDTKSQSSNPSVAERSLKDCISEQPDSRLVEFESLCAECSQLDFEWIFNLMDNIKDPGWRGITGGVIVANLGSRPEVGEQAACALCRLFSHARIPANHPYDYTLRINSALMTYARQYLFHPGQFRGNDNVLLSVYPTKCKTPIEYRYICRTNPSEGVNRDRFWGRIVPSYINFSIIQEWLSFCRENHTASCQKAGLQSLQGFRLINCEKLNIVSASLSNSYAALSYVWGSVESTTSYPSRSTREISQPECRELALPSPLPKVISDAILVTRNLGMQFLWVDKYCIDQDNPAEKHNQISSMDMIYGEAEICLIAAAGEDENAGLPGVGTVPRVHQPFVKIRNMMLVSALRQPTHAIHTTKWFSRAWTYQEAVLSKRRLVFTNEQMYFECRSMYCYESVYFPLNFLHYNNTMFHHPACSGIFSGANERAKFVRDHQLALTRICTHIEEYTTKRLTYESDSLKAFLGILQDFMRASPPLYHCWGLPIEPYGNDGSTQSLAMSLTWYHSIGPIPHRRRAFPSWSWAGWEGKAEVPYYKIHNQENLLFRYFDKNAFLPSISLEENNEKLVALEDCDLTELSKGSNLYCPVLHLEACVLSANVFQTDNYCFYHWPEVKDSEINNFEKKETNLAGTYFKIDISNRSLTLKIQFL